MGDRPGDVVVVRSDGKRSVRIGPRLSGQAERGRGKFHGLAEHGRRTRCGLQFGPEFLLLRTNEMAMPPWLRCLNCSPVSEQFNKRAYIERQAWEQCGGRPPPGYDLKSVWEAS